jgi:hypothetical protein
VPARHIFLRHQGGQPLCASRVWFSLVDTFQSQLHGRESLRKQSVMGHSVALQQHHAGLTSPKADRLSICMELERLPESTHSENLSQRYVEVLENQRGERAGWRGFFQKSCQVIMEGLVWAGMTVWLSIEKHTRGRKWSVMRLRGGGQTDAVSGEVTDQLSNQGHSSAFSLIPVQKDGRCLFRSIVVTVARMQGSMLSHEAETRETDSLRACTYQETTGRRREWFVQQGIIQGDFDEY